MCINKILAFTMATIISLVFFTGCDNNADKNTTSTSKYANEINKDEVLSIQINATAENWQYLLDNATDKEYISADVIINGTEIKNVGIRAKGNSSLSSVYSSESDRYSFKIKFDKYVDGQTYLGLDKMVLNSGWADNTFMKEYLSYDIMNYIGVDSPIYAFADISVNNETWGLYLMIEDYEDSYLEHTQDSEGVLYKPDSMDMNDMGKMEFPSNNENSNSNTSDDVNSMPEMPNSDTNFDPSQFGGQQILEGMPSMQNGEFDPSQFSGQIPDGMPPTESNNTENNEVTQNDNGFVPPNMNRDNNNRGGGFGNASSGVSLEYTDDNTESYSNIFDNNKTKTESSDEERLIAALKQLNEGDDIESCVDVDACLRYFAAHNVVVNLDSYTSNMGHNYILHESNGVITILPWDYNLAFGGFMSGSSSDVVNFPIDTPVSNVEMSERPLLAKLLENDEYLAKYHVYLQEIIDGYFADGKFEERVSYLNSLISDYIKNDPTKECTFEEYETAVAELIKLGNLRGESIQGQLNGTIPSTSDGQTDNPDALIDASSVNLSALGSQGGGNMNGFKMNNDMFNNIDMDTMKKAMDIIGQTSADELTDEQKNALYELGITDEQIEEYANMSKNFDNMGIGGFRDKQNRNNNQDNS